MFSSVLSTTPPPAIDFKLVLLVVAAVVVIFLIKYFYNQYKMYGSTFRFANGFVKNILAPFVVLVFLITGYNVLYPTIPPSKTLAIVFGNTQNSPKPELTNDLVEKYLNPTMMTHQGDDDVDELAESLVFISAVRQPKRIDIGSGAVKLNKIDSNNTNAKRALRHNKDELQKYLDSNMSPVDHGANYLDAILEAKSDTDIGTNVIVVGSGLSDTGDLDFAHSNILNNSSKRDEVINQIIQKYGRDYLSGYNFVFYGLGDTVMPQEQLSPIQRDVVRDIYKKVIRGLGGSVTVNSKTVIGNSVVTNYKVSTTDTGCGDTDLVFDDDSVKFVGDKADFISPVDAESKLSRVYEIYSANPDAITGIQVDGYIAHFNTPVKNLSQLRADAVKKVLVSQGIPSDKITATGRGYGPHNVPEQDRMVSVKIQRNNSICGN